MGNEINTGMHLETFLSVPNPKDLRTLYDECSLIQQHAIFVMEIVRIVVASIWTKFRLPKRPGRSTSTAGPFDLCSPSHSTTQGCVLVSYGDRVSKPWPSEPRDFRYHEKPHAITKARPPRLSRNLGQ